MISTRFPSRMGNTISADRLTPEELRSLDAARQYALLNDLYGEIGRLGRAREEHTWALRTARQAVLLCAPGPEKQQALAAKLDAEAMRDALKVEYDYRREQVKILQTLLRAPPA